MGIDGTDPSLTQAVVANERRDVVRWCRGSEVQPPVVVEEPLARGAAAKEKLEVDELVPEH